LHFLPISAEHAIAFLGASEAGLTLTSLNPTYTAGEIRGQLVNSRARYIVTLPVLLAKVEEAVGDTDIQVSHSATLLLLASCCCR
jgi:4-coumarate--CoA ligase